MKPVGIIGTTLSLFLLLGIAAPVYGQGNSDHQNNGDKQGNSDKKDKGNNKGQNKGNNKGNNKSDGKAQSTPTRPVGQRQVQAAAPSSRPERQQRVSDQNQRREDVRSQQRQQPVVQVQQQQDRPAGWDKGKKTGWNGGSVPPGQQGRLPQERQQQLIVLQQQRVVQYRQHLDTQQRLAQQYSAQLQQQNHMASYRYQQQYIEALRRQQSALQRARNYNNDPYYYTAPIYRYNRGGSYYETNQYGADVLRQAVNNGYAQGYQAGQAARQDRWSSGYQDLYAYQDANYGYDGYYIEPADYNFYFRQGFSRGYEDGYNSRYQYGQYSAGKYTILGTILGRILDFQSLR
jgi:hypothetical protein